MFILKCALKLVLKNIVHLVVMAKISDILHLFLAKYLHVFRLVFANHGLRKIVLGKLILYVCEFAVTESQNINYGDI